MCINIFYSQFSQKRDRNNLIKINSLVFVVFTSQFSYLDENTVRNNEDNDIFKMSQKIIQRPLRCIQIISKHRRIMARKVPKASILKSVTTM